MFAFLPTELNNKKSPNPSSKTFINPHLQRTLSSTRGVFSPLQNPWPQPQTYLPKTHFYKISPHLVLTQIEGVTTAKA